MTDQSTQSNNIRAVNDETEKPSTATNVAAKTRSLQMACQEVIRQPVIDLSGLRRDAGKKDLPDIKGKIGKSKELCTTYMDVTHPKMLDLTNDIQLSASVFERHKVKVLAGLDIFAAGDKKGQEAASISLDLMSAIISGHDKAARSVTGELNDFKDDISAIASEINTDIIAIRQVVKEDKLLTEELLAKIKQLEADMERQKQEGLFSGSVLGGIVGQFLQSIPIIGTALTFVSDFVNAREMQKLMKKKQRLLQQIDQLQLAMTALETMEGQAGNVAKNLQFAASVVQELENAWNLLINGLGEALEMINTASEQTKKEAIKRARAFVLEGTFLWQEALKQNAQISRLLVFDVRQKQTINAEDIVRPKIAFAA